MPALYHHESSVLIIDMQTRLLPAIAGHQELVGCVERFAQAARLLDVPVLATEHCADKIGPTTDALTPHIDEVFQKTHFDATQEAGLTHFMRQGRHRVLLAGVESHICVLQTGLGLKRMGFEPVLVTDGVGSRQPSDREAALARWAHHGLEAVSSEMALFEWMGTPAHPCFREVLALLKGAPEQSSQ